MGSCIKLQIRSWSLAALSAGDYIESSAFLAQINVVVTQDVRCNAYASRAAQNAVNGRRCALRQTVSSPSAPSSVDPVFLLVRRG